MHQYYVECNWRPVPVSVVSTGFPRKKEGLLHITKRCTLHPHLHILLTDGGFLPDGTFRHLLYFDSDKIEELFRAEVLRLLLKKQLISEQTVNNMLS